MVKFKALAAGMVALGALAASPAAAEGLQFGIYGPDGGLIIDRHGARIVDVHGPGNPGYDPRPVHYGRWLMPQQIRRILRRQGYQDIEIAGRRGRIYVAYATNRIWERLRLVVSARNGRILDAVVVSRPGRGHWDDRPGGGMGRHWDGYDDDDLDGRDRADRGRSPDQGGGGRPGRYRG